MKISITQSINAPIETVWNAWTSPEHITQWNFASDDWHCPAATNDLRVGKTFNSRMEAKDGSMGFDFEGEYTEIILYKKIEYKLGDGRRVHIDFSVSDGACTITETFEAEDENSAEQQRAGWQAILDNFKSHVEGL